MAYGNQYTTERSLKDQIDIYNNILSSYLWTNYNYTAYGRAYLIEDIPKVFVSGNEYKEVLVDDTLAANSFFFIKEWNKEDEVKGKAFNLNAAIIFGVNLKTLYPSLSYRAEDSAISDAYAILNGYTELDIQKIIVGMDAISDFSTLNIQYNQPFCLFKFQTIIKYINY